MSWRWGILQSSVWCRAGWLWQHSWRRRDEHTDASSQYMLSVSADLQYVCRFIHRLALSTDVLALVSDWLIERGLTSHQTHIGHIGNRFLLVKWPNQQCQSTERRWVLRIRLQFHQVHPTMLTIIQQLCSMKQIKHKQIYAQWNGPSEWAEFSNWSFWRRAQAIDCAGTDNWDQNS